MKDNEKNPGRPRMSYEEKTRPIYFSLSNPTADLLVAQALEREQSVQSLIRDAVRQYLGEGAADVQDRK